MRIVEVLLYQGWRRTRVLWTVFVGKILLKRGTLDMRIVEVLLYQGWRCTRVLCSGSGGFTSLGEQKAGLGREIENRPLL